MKNKDEFANFIKMVSPTHKLSGQFIHITTLALFLKL
jgi:hypothetical protein